MAHPFDDDAGVLGKVLASIREIVLVVGPDGVIQYINHVEEGYERSQVLGMPSSAILCSDSSGAFEAALRSVLATGEDAEYEVRIMAPDGSPAWYRSRMSPFRQEGEIVGAVIVASNITKLKESQEAVAKLRLLLPVCSWCGRLQNDEGGWETIEAYLGKRTDSKVTHGMCSDCHQRALDDINQRDTRDGVA